MSKRNALRALKRERSQALDVHMLTLWWGDWDNIPSHVKSRWDRRCIKRYLRQGLVRP